MTTVKELKEQGFRVYVSHRRPTFVGHYDPTTGHMEPVEVTRHEVKEMLAELNSTGLLAEPATFNDFVMSNGGRTTVTICKGAKVDSAHEPPEDGDIIAVGESRCSEKDPFNKKLGLTIALGRALKALGGATPDGHS